MAVGYVDGAALGEALPVEHGVHRQRQAAQLRAVHVDRHLLQALAQREPARAEGLLLAVFYPVVGPDILVGRPQTEDDVLAGVDSRLVLIDPKNLVGARLAVGGGGEHGVDGVGYRVVSIRRTCHNAVDATLQRRQIHLAVGGHTRPTPLGQPTVPVVLAHFIYIMWEATVVVLTVYRLVHPFLEHSRGKPHEVGPLQTLQCHHYPALLRRAVDVGQLYTHRR